MILSEISYNLLQIIAISIFGIVFGFFETITNLTYLITGNYGLPRLQHGKEIPADASDAIVVHKMIQMMLLGIFLLIISFISLSVAPQLFIVGAVLIFVNGTIDFAKFRKKDIFIVWCLISIFCVVSVII